MPLALGDCLELMLDIADGSIDMILCDLPYGKTACGWDTVIPFDKLWEQYLRICKPNAAICLFASQPFTSALVMSNPKMYRHEWIWLKDKGSNFASTGREPMKEHESILVFSKGKWTYNKQMQERTGSGKERAKYPVKFNTNKREIYGDGFQKGTPHHMTPKLRVPSSYQKFNREVGLHPTQKPVALCEYLIKTYTNPGEVVLDNCMGSGTTGVAALNLNRRFLGIELDPTYFNSAKERMYTLTRK